MSQTVGKITFNQTQILGAGSSSKVYEGTFSGRQVAVKKIPKSNVKLHETEINLLVKSDLQKNIVRYFTTESDDQFFYIALERCHFSIKDYVERSDLKQIISRKQVITQIFEGMEWLHSLKIGKLEESVHPLLNISTLQCIVMSSQLTFCCNRSLKMNWK